MLNKLNPRYRKPLAIALAILIPLATAGGWLAAKSLASPTPIPVAALPEGAIPIAPEFLGTYDGVQKEFKELRERIDRANLIMQQIVRLSLDKADPKIPLEDYEKYRLDDTKRALIKMSPQEVEQMKQLQRQQQGR